MIQVDVEIDSISVDIEMAGEVPSDVIVKAGIAYLFNEFTGQTIEYTPGDDGYHFQQGTYLRVNPENPLYFAELDYTSASPHTTLVNNNSFGNKNRFTDEVGGQSYSNNYTVDHYTRKGVYLIPQSGTWPVAMQAALNSSILGFDDWRVGNKKVAESIQKWTAGTSAWMNYSPFNSVSAGNWWTSTTNPNNSTLAMVVNHINAGVGMLTKTSTASYYLIRDHL